jgi:RHS repeat-associated protein
VYGHTRVSNGIGRLTGRVDSSGSYASRYDAHGNLVREDKTINSILYTTQYAYNEDNNLTSITYPSGRTVTYTLDAAGKITQVDTTLNGNPKTLASSITYLPYGGITGLTFGNAISLTHGYDNQYRTSSIVVGSILDRTYNYDANGNITYIDDGESAGNEALETAGLYTYDQGTNLLADMWREVPVVYDYDEDGNTISANNRTFTYDLSNRLITVQEGSTTLGQYVYNALNQRIKKILPAETTIFHYDLQGHLIAETTDAGITLAEYFYLGDQPLAMIRPSEALYYYHNDHLGTPQILTNDSATVSWKAAYTPFGEAEISVQAVENPFRLPGQYYDQETGLHYNWNRYYDPKTGRYFAPDPVGLQGGINLFGYATNNPIRFVDTSGEIVLPPGIGISIQKCYEIARKIRREGSRKYPWTPDDRYNHMRHCWASCTLAQEGGNACSFIAGWYQELSGVYDPADVEANAKGRSCASSGDCAKCCHECDPTQIGRWD